jgi:hypothetical protein
VFFAFFNRIILQNAHKALVTTILLPPEKKIQTANQKNAFTLVSRVNEAAKKSSSDQSHKY